MRKSEEILHEDSCLSRAFPDELLFVLLCRDAAAPVAIRAWCAERIRLGKNQPRDPEIVNAMKTAEIMDGEISAIRQRLGR